MTVRTGENVPEGYNLGAVAGRAFERERIIKLLEQDHRHVHSDGKPSEWCPACKHIALIEGENNE